MATFRAGAGSLRIRPLTAAGTVAWLLACAALAAGGILLSARGNPLTAPAICFAVTIVVATLARPEIGIAAWFPLVPLGLLGIGIGPQWLLASLWGVFLFIMAIARRADSVLRAGGEHVERSDLSERLGTSRERPIGAVEQVRRWRHRLPPLAPALLALFAITLLEVIFGAHPSAALKSIRTMVTGTLVFFAITTFVRTRLQMLWVLRGIVLTAGLVGAVALNDYRTGNTTFGFFGPAGELVARVTAGFGQPNQLGGFLAILVPLTIAAMMLLPRGKLLCLLATVLAVGGVYVSFSRGALLALAAIPLVFLGFKRSLVAIPLALVALLNFIPGVLKERFATLTEAGGAAASRLDIWRAAEKIWSAHPLAGVGPGDFSQAYTEANIPGKAYLPSTIFQPPPHAHNLFLNLLAEQGLLGLLAFLALLGLAVAGMVRTRRSQERWIRVMSTALLATIAVFVVHDMFDVTLIEGTGEYVWALFGVCSALMAIESRRAATASGSSPPAARAAPRPARSAGALR